MFRRPLARRLGGRAWPRWAAIVALFAAGTLAPDLSLAASGPQRRARPLRGSERERALPNVTYTGFRLLKDGRAVVYVELTGKVQVTVQKHGNLLTYELLGARVALKNNRNPLITSRFPTILESARLVVVKPARSGKGRQSPKGESGPPRVQLVLRLREDATPTYALSETPAGALLEVTLPAAGAISRSKS